MGDGGKGRGVQYRCCCVRWRRSGKETDSCSAVEGGACRFPCTPCPATATATGPLKPLAVLVDHSHTRHSLSLSSPTPP